jgi:hypothetical protein
MKSRIITLGVFALTAAVVGLYPMWELQATGRPTPVVVAPSDQPRIQIAVLLDTSGSMSGLINQTRDQLWQMVNQFAETRKNGKTPVLEVAVYEYGNSRLSSRDGYIREVTPLTSELDEVSAALFSLTTSGGDEYCGYAIQTAVGQLAWSNSDVDIKAIFIAGNEPFTQGPVPFRKAIAAARAKGVTVNTIHAGDADEGARTGWRDGAVLAGGDYMSIDHNHRIAHVNAPQDERLAELNQKLNDTYIPFGNDGEEKRARQEDQDRKNAAVSQGQLAKRAKSKVSSMYDNSSWDLVDALEKGAVELDEVAPAALPAEMRTMNEAEQTAYVKKQAAERERIKEEIGRLSEAREAYVAEQRAAAPAPAVSTVEDAMMQAIEKEAARKQYEFGVN